MKRGEISMEVIIIAAIALLVLVILSVLLIRSGTTVGKECQNIGGTCTPGDATTCEEGRIPSPHNCGSGNICCVKLGSEDV